MRRHKRWIIALGLALSVLGGGCGGKTEARDSETNTGTELNSQNLGKESEGAQETESESAQETGEAAKALTLADGEARLIYANNTYAVAAYYGPKDISASFCREDGSIVGGMVGYGHPSDGWTLIISREFPEGYDYSGIGVMVTDQGAEKNADGRYPTQNYLDIEQMSTEEMRDIGLDFLDGHCCLVGGGQEIYSSNSFGITFGITWFDDYYFTSFREIEGFADRFSYFAGDGTPLEEYFDGYSSLEITTMINMFDVELVQDSTSGDKAQNEKMCGELKDCHPYMIYTGTDGTQQRFDLLVED